MELNKSAESVAKIGLEQDLPVIAESTTSRVLVNNEIMRIVQFTFDAGQLLTEHLSPRAVAVELVSGELIFSVNGVDHTMHSGDVIYLAPNARHAVKAIQPSRMTLVMVDVAETKAGTE